MTNYINVRGMGGADESILGTSSVLSPVSAMGGSSANKYHFKEDYSATRANGAAADQSMTAGETKEVNKMRIKTL